LYRAYNNKDLEQPFELKLLPGGPAANAQERLTGPYYTTNFEEIKAEALAEYNARLPKEKAIKKTIELYYDVDSDYVENKTGREHWEIFGGQYTAGKTAKAKVVWQMEK